MCADPAKALHVLTLTPFFPSDLNDVGGCFVADPIEELRNLGMNSTVIAVSPLHNRRRRAVSSAPAEWVRYFQFPGTLGLSSAGKTVYARLAGPVGRIHRDHPINVIHAHATLPCGYAAMLLSQSLKIPFVVTVHGLDVLNTCSRGGAPAAWRRTASLKVYAAARTVICISRRVEEMLKAATRSDTHSLIVHNGVNPNFFSPNQEEGEQKAPEILAVGSLLPSKGHDLVLRAVAKLRPSFGELHCRIIGEGPDGARLQSMARESGIEKQVQFAGRQSRLQVAEAMRRCSVFVLPSRNEALGCVYLEAMSCGKPVIGCRGQGIADVIEHGKNGWLIPPDGLDELVAAISTLLKSHELRARIEAAARRTILEKLTLSSQAQRLAAAYREALA